MIGGGVKIRDGDALAEDVDFACLTRQIIGLLLKILEGFGALERAVFEISARLGSSKRIGRVVVAAEDFSEANGCLSPQFKVRRQHVLEKYRGEIAACYPA